MILYELLTGHRPYQIPTRSLPELTRIVCEVEPTRPSQIVGRSKIRERAMLAGVLELVGQASEPLEASSVLCGAGLPPR